VRQNSLNLVFIFSVKPVEGLVSAKYRYRYIEVRYSSEVSERFPFFSFFAFGIELVNKSKTGREGGGREKDTERERERERE